MTERSAVQAEIARLEATAAAVRDEVQESHSLLSFLRDRDSFLADIMASGTPKAEARARNKLVTIKEAIAFWRARSGLSLPLPEAGARVRMGRIHPAFAESFERAPEEGTHGVVVACDPLALFPVLVAFPLPYCDRKGNIQPPVREPLGGFHLLPEWLMSDPGDEAP